MIRSKVVHLTTVHRADDNRIYFKEAGAIAELGCHVTVVAPETRDAGTSGASVDRVFIPAYRRRVLRMTIGILRMYAAARRLRAHVYHLHDPELLPVGVVLRLLGATVIYDAHEDLHFAVRYKQYLPSCVRAPLARLLLIIEMAFARVMSGVVAATPAIGSRLASSNSRTVVVQNFPRVEELSIASRAKRPRPPGAVLRLLYVGAISEARGITTMLDALHLLNGDARLALAGSFSSLLLESKARAHAAWKHVDYHGFASREMVCDLLSSADVGLVLFHPEPNYLYCYPTKLFEYMAAGLPVVASDIPFWKTIVERARCGVLADPVSPSSIALSIRELASSPEAMRKMGEAGMEAVHSMYSWEREGEALRDFYRALLRDDRAE